MQDRDVWVVIVGGLSKSNLKTTKQVSRVICQVEYRVPGITIRYQEKGVIKDKALYF